MPDLLKFASLEDSGQVQEAATLVKKVYGVALACYMIGTAQTARLGHWSARKGTPPNTWERHNLGVLFTLTEILLSRFDQKRARAWMTTLQPYLGDRFPMDLITVDPDFVRQAAIRELMA
jgi:hypothetical protein